MSARTRAANFLRRLLSRGERAAAVPQASWRPSMHVVSREAPQAMRDAFVAAGHRESHFFPHRVHRIPKCGPDGFLLARDMTGERDVSRMWQIVLFATPPATDEFPPEIFFDRALLWHEQHFHQAGHVACVDLVMRDDVLYTMAHQSDLVQRISRRRELKTRVEKVFKGWHHLLLNAIAGFAVDHGARELRVPTAALAMRHTDPKRTVQPELFERVYDRAVQHLFDAQERDGWWCIDMARARASVVLLPRREDVVATERTVCIVHDVERGYGHRDVDPEFAARADADAPAALPRMLAIERRVGAGIRATYNVVGCFLDEVREEIERDGHALAFHSYDHGPDPGQLARCRKADYRIKGYRPPRSQLTDDLRDERLYLHNVEWLASAGSSLGVRTPAVIDHVARIPIAFDDFPLHTGRTSYDDWHRATLDAIATREFVAFGLHDCYASHWLDGYEQLLNEASALARIRTMDEVASLLYLATGV